MTLLEELLAYVDLDHADRERLHALHDRLAPSFPAIAARFYEAINASPGARSVLRGQALQSPGKASRTSVESALAPAGNQPPPGYYQPDALRFQVIQMDSRRPYLLDSSSGQLWVLGQQEWVVYAPAPGQR